EEADRAENLPGQKRCEAEGEQECPRAGSQQGQDRILPPRIKLGGGLANDRCPSRCARDLLESEDDLAPLDRRSAEGALLSTKRRKCRPVRHWPPDELLAIHRPGYDPPGSVSDRQDHG